jgi:hypothetical protein
VINRQGKYKEAEAMNKRTLEPRKTVLGLEHPDTLMSMCCLAHLLANQHNYDEFCVLHEKACAKYPTVPRNDHLITRAAYVANIIPKYLRYKNMIGVSNFIMYQTASQVHKESRNQM